MQGLSHRAGRSVRAHRAGRVVTGAFCLALAVTLAQTLSVSPTVAQNGPSRDASDTVLAWGDNKDGELGDGTTTDSSTPIAVDLPAGTTITAIAAGHDHSLAVTSAGTALAWGNNLFGQLGDGSTTDSSTPIAVDLPAGTTVTAIAAGDDHSLAVTSAGTALAWGDNDRGELGDGTTTRRDTPVDVDLPAGTTVTAIAAGIGHSLALTSAGTVLTWGLNSDGQLGDGTTTDSSTPIAVDLPAGTTVTAIAAGSLHSLAVTTAGTILAWGNNSDGQLGDGTTTNSSTPIAVNLPASTTITAIDGGRDHSLAVTSAGSALAWGDNDDGQLGDGTTTNSSTPIAVNLPADTTVTATTAGSLHSLAVTTAGTILAWGNNSDGRLGDGTTTNSSTPIAVNLPADTTVTATTAGSLHSLAVTTAGTILAWGNNSDGQLGDGTTTNSSTPIAVNLPADTTVTATTAGSAHSMALVAPPPDLPTTGPSLPTTLTIAALLLLTGAALIHLAHRYRPARRPR